MSRPGFCLLLCGTSSISGRLSNHVTMQREGGGMCQKPGGSLSRIHSKRLSSEACLGDDRQQALHMCKSSKDQPTDTVHSTQAVLPEQPAPSELYASCAVHKVQLVVAQVQHVAGQCTVTFSAGKHR